MPIPQIIKDIGFDFSWDVEKVWRLDEPVIILPIDDLLWHFDIPFWESEGTDDRNLSVWEALANPEKEVSHYEMIQKADLKYPVDLMQNKGKLLLLDGLHRLAKAYLKGEKEIRARIIPESRISEILKD